MRFFWEQSAGRYRGMQGDIVGILDNSGNLVVKCKYDAWGKLLSTTGSLADTLGKRNPFRYRGYVYDEEKELAVLPAQPLLQPGGWAVRFSRCNRRHTWRTAVSQCI